MPGGGVALLRAKKAVDALKSRQCRHPGRHQDRARRRWKRRSARSPRTPASRLDRGRQGAGESPATSASTRRTKNMATWSRPASSIPTKVVRIALQDAASVAGLLITTEAMIAEAPKKEAGIRRCLAAAAWAAWIIDSFYSGINVVSEAARAHRHLSIGKFTTTSVRQQMSAYGPSRTSIDLDGKSAIDPKRTFIESKVSALARHISWATTHIVGLRSRTWSACRSSPTSAAPVLLKAIYRVTACEGH